MTPTSAELIPYRHHQHAHSVPADPAVTLTGPTVVEASPALRRVCQRPIRFAFANTPVARLHGYFVFEAHLMGFTFVTDCASCAPVALHLPSRGRSYRGIISQTT